MKTKSKFRLIYELWIMNLIHNFHLFKQLQNSLFLFKKDNVCVKYYNAHQKTMYGEIHQVTSFSFLNDVV